MSSTADRALRVDSEDLGWIDRSARRMVFQQLENLRSGSIEIREGQERQRFGSFDATGLEAVVEVKNPRFYRSLVLGGSLGASESYVDRDWSSPDLTQVIRIMARNRSATTEIDGGLARLGEWAGRLWHRSRANHRRGSRRNILAHYDLGNGLFERFLDPTMTYSSAIFENPGMSLEDAQRAKLDRLCKRLDLRPDDHLLEIGTGWGSMAIHAAKEYGCRVTSTTISPSQFAEARRRVDAAGLSHQIQLLQVDYRDLQGQYDKLVSVEMIEAVGHEYLPIFFAVCSRLLKPQGLMAIQAITIADRNYEAARNSVDFIQRHIFPGGAIPSVSALTSAVAEVTDLTPNHLEDLGLHYAETLKRWRVRFENEWGSIESLGFDETFRRLWNYYFSYCEGGFLERVISVVQLVLAKPDHRPTWVGQP